MMTPIDQPVPAKPVRTPGQRVIAFVRRNRLQLGIVGVMAVMWVFFLIAGPRTFTSSDIYKAFAESVPFYGIMSLTITLLVIAQEIDLSFGSVMAVSVVAFIGVFNVTGSPLFGFISVPGWGRPILGLIACLGTGFLVGLLNGIIVVKIGIPSLIATIGTQFFWRGFILVVTGAKLESLIPAKDANPILHDVLVGRLFGELPAQMIWMVVVAFLVWLLLNHHRFGAHIYLIGDNNNSARLMGVNADRTRMLTFAIVGMSAGLAGLIASYDVLNFFPSLGDGYLLQTLAAVFLGGTPVLGGVGTILGTFVGCFIIGAIEPGTVAIGLTGFWTQLIYGFIIVVSVAMHTILRRRER
jgi:simple sugar transport system permease protein